MSNNSYSHLQLRTDAKLRYSQIYLDELRKLEPLRGNDLDRAHQESFLFHLFGARDGFLMELNHYYRCGLEIENLTAGKLKGVLMKQLKSSPELLEIYNLEQDPNSWLSRAKQMRNYSTHTWWLRRAYHIDGSGNQQVWLDIPSSGLQITKHFVDEFDDWVKNMINLITRLRENAILKNSDS